MPFNQSKSKAASVAVRNAVAAGDVDAVRSALSPRQRAFCEEYIVDFNGGAAVVRAGYSLKYADQQAYSLLHNEGVAFYVDHLMRSKEAKITAVNPDYVIQKVTEIITKDGAKDGDKLRGLELLARHLGMFIDRTEITGKDGEAIKMQQVEEEVAGLMNTIKRLADKKTVTIE